MQIEALEETLLSWIKVAALLIEALAVVIIVGAIAVGSLQYLQRRLGQGREAGAYEAYRQWLAKALLVGLEVLVAADIIRTVALEPTLQSVAVLGLLVIIRTFLSWSLVVEIEHRWPWQTRRGAEDVAHSVER